MDDPIAAGPAPWMVRAPAAPRRLWLHAGLLMATFLTAAAAGSWIWEGTLDLSAPWTEWVELGRLVRGVPYATLLLLILGAHEAGHFLACRHYGVQATLPFFIPGPPMLIGTFGAVIRIRSVIPSRRALFDIAAAGPIAGFIVALPVLVVGVARATELPPSAPLHGAGLGPPLVSLLLERLFHGGASLQVGSIYGAAWVGMLVTSMNLFPVGQLDGGHAVFALSPRWHRIASWATIGAVAAMVLAQSFGSATPSAYTLWLGVLLLMRHRHPRLREAGEPLGAKRVAVAVVLAVLFLLTFVPVPIVIT